MRRSSKRIVSTFNIAAVTNDYYFFERFYTATYGYKETAEMLKSYPSLTVSHS